jgi:lysophospholipase L1-like esterase
MRRSFFLLLSALVMSVAAQAQLVDEFNPPRGNCCLPNTANALANSARTLADQLQDWNQLGRYHAANEDLKKQPADPKRVVFMGDSITDGWRLAEYFPDKPYVNRGISGQTTPQMLARMYADVIDLKPAAMVVLAGTNDIAHNTGPETAVMIEENLMAMTELAQVHGIKVILCSVTPISDYPFLQGQQAQPAQLAGRGGPAAAPGAPSGGRGFGGRAKQTDGRPPADILKLNAWMKDYAARSGAIYADYFTVLVDDKGWLKDGISADGLHPSADGYKLMVPVVEAAIRKALP